VCFVILIILKLFGNDDVTFRSDTNKNAFWPIFDVVTATDRKIGGTFGYPIDYKLSEIVCM